MAVICWTILKVSNIDVMHIMNGELFPVSNTPEGNATAIDAALQHNLAETAEILFFLIGAMTIVEVIDMHRGLKLSNVLSALKAR